MIEMIGNENHIAKVREIYSNYKKVFGFEHVEPNFRLKITSSIQGDSYMYESKEEKKYEGKYDLTDLNGRLILPKDADLHFIVLINKKQFMGEEDPYIHTIYHELTHLYDYYLYMTDYGNTYILSDKLKDIKYFWDVYYWSEFHAKRIGSEQYIKYTEERINKVGVKLGLQTEDLIGKINGLRTGFFPFQQTFTELMSYLGRLSVLRENSTICSDLEFLKDFLIQTFGPEVFELYDLLWDMNDYQTAKYRLADFKKIKDRIIRNKF